VNFLLIESLQKFHHYYGDDFLIECPTGSGQKMTICGVANELTQRLTRLFLRDANGRRPIYGGSDKQQRDPHFRDHILFHEFFHGDNGAGLGASHQTGWTGLVARLIQAFGQLDAASVLNDPRWPLARPYRNVSGEHVASAAAARLQH
jgi:hypothetical protein